MKRIFFLLAILLGWVESASAQDFIQNYIFINTGTRGTSSSFANTGVSSFFISWSPQLSINSCSVQVDSSADGITWGSGDLIASQNCTTTGSSPVAALASGKNFVRVDVTVLSGNGSLNVTLKGWAVTSGIAQVTSLPGSCTPGQQFQLIGAPQVYTCGPANTLSPMNIQLVQTPGAGTTFAAVTSSATAFTSPTGANHLLLAMVQMGVASSGNTITITDSLNNTWSPILPNDIGIANIFWTISKGGADTVTATFSGSSAGIMFIAEYSGVLVSHPVLVANDPNGSGAAFLPNARLITPVPGSLMVVLAGNNGGGNSYGGLVNCTARSPLTSVAAFWCDNNNTVAGNTYYNFEQAGGSVDIISQAVAFLPATYAPPSYPSVVRQTVGAVGSPGQIKILASSPVQDVFAGGNQAGNVILLSTIQSGSTNNITSVSDTEGNVYTAQAGGGALADSSNFFFYRTYCAPVLTGGTANNTVTMAMSSGTGSIAGIEVSKGSCTQDTNATGGAGYTLTTGSIGDFILTTDGFSGGGTSFSNLSGIDAFNIPSTSGVQMDVNYFISCQKSNPITSFINTAGNNASSFSIALLPANSNIPCPAASGSLNGINTGAQSITAKGTGLCTASSTLGLYPLGQLATPTCTSTTVANGQVLEQPEYIQSLIANVTAVGVNSSSGVVTVLKNGIATAMTCTIGTNSSCTDFTHQIAFAAADTLAVQVTTQSADTLSGVTVYLNIVPLGPFPLGVQ
jgi:hypothetical protein